jgi:hypothetical protein
VRPVTNLGRSLSLGLISMHVPRRSSTYAAAPLLSFLDRHGRHEG